MDHGIILDSDLKFKELILSRVKKANMMLGIKELVCPSLSLCTYSMPREHIKKTDDKIGQKICPSFSQQNLQFKFIFVSFFVG